MAFGFFSKDKNSTNEQKETSKKRLSFFKDNSNDDVEQNSNNDIYENTSDVSKEPVFSEPHTLDLFEGLEPETNFYNKDNNQPNLNNQNSSKNQEPSFDDVKNKYYVYEGNESYLDEEGRDSDHLYIGPGEPLTPYKKEEIQDENLVNENIGEQENLNSNDTENLNFNQTNTVITGTINPAPVKKKLISDPIDEKEDEAPIYITPGAPIRPKTIEDDTPPVYKIGPVDRQENKETQINQNNVNQNYNNVANSSSSPVEDLSGLQIDKQNLFDNIRKKQALNQNVNQHIEQPNVSQNLNTFSTENNNEPKTNNLDNEPNASRKNNNVSFLFITVLYFRQLFASLFNFTTLGVIFSKFSLKIGPSKPEFMGIAYFVIGLICASVALFIQNITSTSFASELFIILFFLLTGVNCFRGIGNLLSYFTQRRIDTYAKAVSVIITILIFGTLTENLLNIFVQNQIISLGFAALFMLSGFTAATLCYGNNDDPENSFGVLSGLSFCLSTIFTLAILFLILDWVLVLSMIGICLFVRVTIGQYMFAKGLNSSRENVCSIQIITLIFLMMDILFASGKIEFLSSFIINISSYK